MRAFEEVCNEIESYPLISTQQWLRQHKEQPIVIYCAGMTGESIATLLKQIGVPVSAFADSNQAKWGTALCDIPICAPSDVARLFPNALVIVCLVNNYKHAVPQIKQTLLEHGLRNVIYFGELRCLQELYSLEALVMTGNAILPKKNVDNLCHLKNILADECSVGTLINILEDRLSPGSVWELPEKEIYFPSDIFQPKSNDVFVDCGAYSGDTLEAFINQTKNFSDYYAFEPDSKNLLLLQQTIDNLPHVTGNIHVISKAVGAKAGHLYFKSDFGVSSHVSEQGDIVVPVTTLDGELKDVCPTIIKMDLEGYEKETLAGAENIIRFCKPILAVSVYHYPNDLWEIPLMLHKQYPFYSFYLRTYTSEDIVLYAIAQK